MRLTGVTGFRGINKSGRASGTHLLNSLMAYWEGNGGGDTNLISTDRFDLHGSYDLTESGVTVSNNYVSTPPLNIYFASFDRNYTDYLYNSTTDFRFGSSDFTISCWLSSTNGNGDRVAIAVWDDSGNYCWQLDRLGASDTMRFSVSSDGTTYTSVESPTVVGSSGYWYNVFGRRGNTIFLSVNGETENETSFTGSLYNGGTFRWGRPDTGTLGLNWTWAGRIGAVAIWNSALNTDEKAALYNSGDGLNYGSFTS